MSDLREIIKAGLMALGYTALVNDNMCGCGIDDIAPCDEPGIGCQGGWKVPCKREACLNRDENGEQCFCEGIDPFAPDGQKFPEWCYTRNKEARLMSKVEFVSYDGKYPNLCSGALVLRIDGEITIFPEYCMSSGGRVWFDDSWKGHVYQDDWRVEVPVKYRHLQEEINKVVNNNVSRGCCGGCL